MPRFGHSACPTTQHTHHTRPQVTHKHRHKTKKKMLPANWAPVGQGVRCPSHSHSCAAKRGLLFCFARRAAAGSGGNDETTIPARTSRKTHAATALDSVTGLSAQVVACLRPNRHTHEHHNTASTPLSTYPPTLPTLSHTFSHRQHHQQQEDQREHLSALVPVFYTVKGRC